MQVFPLQLMHRQAAGSSVCCLGRIRDAGAVLLCCVKSFLPSLQAWPQLGKETGSVTAALALCLSCLGRLPCPLPALLLGEADTGELCLTFILL